MSEGALVERPYAEPQSYEELEEESAQALGRLFGQAVAVIAEEPWEGTKFFVMTLNEMMEPIVAAMRILDGIALGIFVILLVITGVGILNTFRMIIIERTREIGTMRAFGMQKKTVRSIFLVGGGHHQPRRRRGRTRSRRCHRGDRLSHGVSPRRGSSFSSTAATSPSR